MSVFVTARRLVRTIWAPSQAFEEVREGPACLGPFLVVGLGAAAIACVTLPVFERLFLLSLSEPLSPDRLERLARAHRLMRHLSIAGAFLGTLLSGLVSAFLIWLIVQVFEGTAGFKAILSVVFHASVVSLISGTLVSALMLVKAQGGAAGPEDLDIRLGADLLVRGDPHPALKALLAGLNPFSLWYYGLLTAGVRVTCGLSRSRSAWVVGAFWAICVAFWSGAAWALASLRPPTSSL
ncbi:YIP1 family protein [bacterium]|nr:YIP1 family protein [bacterium]